VKRLSIEKHKKNNSYHLVSTNKTHQVPFLNDEQENEEQKSMTSTAVVSPPPTCNHTDETHYYQRRETVGPVYCQCSIQ
jgi:hypothetical protein